MAVKDKQEGEAHIHSTWRKAQLMRLAPKMREEMSKMGMSEAEQMEQVVDMLVYPFP